MKKKKLYVFILIMIIMLCALVIVKTKTKFDAYESKIGAFNYSAVKASYYNLESLNDLLDKEFTLENHDAMLKLLNESEAWLQISFNQKSTNDSTSNNIGLDNLDPSTPAEYFDSVKDNIEMKVRHLRTLSKEIDINSIEISELIVNIKETINHYKSMTEILDEVSRASDSYEEFTLNWYKIFNTNEASETIEKLQEIYSEVLFNVEN